MSTQDPRYEKNKPGQTDPFSDWQQNIQTNFALLFQAFSNNHVPFYSSNQPSTTDQGKHTYVQLFSGSRPQTELSENNIYSQLDVNNASQLFMAMQNNTVDFQYTTGQAAYLPNNGLFSTCLPGNFQFAFGIFPFSGSNFKIGLDENVVDIAYASASPLASAVVNRANYFYVQVINDDPNSKKKSLNIVWNGGSFPSPGFFFFMFIAKWKEVS